MSAPTTAEVREALAKEEAEVAAEPESQTDYWAGATYGAAGVYRRVALPLAEHRDALAAALTTIALAAGLGADATAEDVAARVGEMRGALVEMFAAEVAHSETMKGWSGSAIPKRARASERLNTAIAAIANLARRLAEEAGRG